MSNTSRSGFNGPSVTIVRAVANSRSACSKLAAATGMFGDAGANGPARKNNTIAAISSVLP